MVHKVATTLKIHFVAFHAIFKFRLPKHQDEKLNRQNTGRKKDGEAYNGIHYKHTKVQATSAIIFSIFFKKKIEQRENASKNRRDKAGWRTFD